MSNAKKPYVIVAGVDYSELSELALDQAIEIAASVATHTLVELHALHVVSALPPGPWIGSPPANAPLGTQLSEDRAELLRYLAQKFDALRSRDQPDTRLPRLIGHIRIESPAQQIAQLAADLEADLVVVGTHGRRGAARALLGSVAEGVVRLAPCPVLVVRPKRLVTIATIDPPCPECVKTREATKGEHLWCEQHAERHGQRHTYHQGDRVSADGSMPLLFRG